MVIDYNKLDPKCVSTVRTIEQKPHCKYIRYLLTKRYSPRVIKEELFRAGLSAPHEEQTIKYYLSIIDPAIKHFKIDDLYKEYKKLALTDNKKGGYKYKGMTLSFKIDLAADVTKQIGLLKLIAYLGIEELWYPEILRFYGSANSIPNDPETGEKIITCAIKNGYEKVLYHEKRYLVDKLLLENMPDSRIVEYLQERHKVSDINASDVRAYRNIFFNVKAVGIEDVINSLIAEKEEIENTLKNMERSEDFNELPMSERMIIKRHNEKRIEDLKDEIRTLTAQHAEAVYGAAEANSVSYEAMFVDVMHRAYGRFVQLDSDKRMDVVDPLLKMANLMKSAHDKIEDIKDREEKAQYTNIDRNAGEVMLELYKRRADEIADEELDKANKRITGSGVTFSLDPNVSPDDIAGLNELGINITKEDE